MKNWPIRFPTPREPLCSITQTRSSSSRQSSMKWLPVPSVPRWFSVLPRRSRSYLTQMRSKPSLNAAHALALRLGNEPHAPRSPFPPCRVRPCGTAASMSERAPSSESGRSADVIDVRAAIMPQPMSTPTAAGTIAPRVGITLPTVAPIPRCTSGITATWRWMNGSNAILRSCSLAESSTGTPRVHGLDRVQATVERLVAGVRHGFLLTTSPSQPPCQLPPAQGRSKAHEAG